MTKELSEATRQHIRNIITAGPFGVHVGLAVDAIELDHVSVRLLGSEHIMNGYDVVHGGAIAALLDAAAAAAAWATPDAKPSTRGITVAMTINFISAGPPGDLVADATVISRGGTLTIVDVVARNPSGGTVAKAQVTYKLDLARDRRLAES